MKKRTHLFINSPNTFPASLKLEANYLLIIINSVYIIPGTDGSNVTSLPHDFSHLEDFLFWYLCGLPNFLRELGLSIRECTAMENSQIHWSSLWACEGLGIGVKKDFLIPLLCFSYLTRAEFESLTTLLYKGSLSWSSCQLVMIEQVYLTCHLMGSFLLPCLHWSQKSLIMRLRVELGFRA